MRNLPLDELNLNYKSRSISPGKELNAASDKSIIDDSEDEVVLLSSEDKKLSQAGKEIEVPKDKEDYNSSPKGLPETLPNSTSLQPSTNTKEHTSKPKETRKVTKSSRKLSKLSDILSKVNTTNKTYRIGLSKKLNIESLHNVKRP